jgi:hypothetical protein
VDHSAVMAITLSQVKLPDKERKKGVIAQAVKLIETWCNRSTEKKTILMLDF